MTGSWCDWGDSAFRKATLDVMDAGVMSDGPEVRQLEEQMGERLGRPVLGVSSGTAALQMALEAIGVRGREVIVPAYGWPATAAAAYRAGATVRWADVHPATYCVTSESVSRVLSGQTAAVIVVHLHGYPCPVAPLQALSALPVVEDCCQAPGATVDNREVGFWGRYAAFSLNPKKPLAGGEGGLLACLSPLEAAYARVFRTTAFQSPEHPGTAVAVGDNRKLTEMSAALASVNLERLDDFNQQAKANAARIFLALPRYARPAWAPGHTWHQVRVRDRRKLQDKIEAAGVPTFRWQRHALPDHPAFERGPDETPIADEVARTTFAIGSEDKPYGALTDEEATEWAQKIETAVP